MGTQLQTALSTTNIASCSIGHNVPPWNASPAKSAASGYSKELGFRCRRFLRILRVALRWMTSSNGSKAWDASRWMLYCIMRNKACLNQPPDLEGTDENTLRSRHARAPAPLARGPC